MNLVIKRTAGGGPALFTEDGQELPMQHHAIQDCGTSLTDQDEGGEFVSITFCVDHNHVRVED